jgi:hypothetical protein
MLGKRGRQHREASFLVVFFGHQVSVSEVKTLGLTFIGLPGNGGSIFVSLLKALSGVYSNFLWDDTVSFLEVPFLENLFGSAGVTIGGGSSCCLADQFGGHFIFSFSFFWLCASLMSILTLCCCKGWV